MESKLQAEIIKWLEAKKKQEKEKPLSQLEAEAKLFCNDVASYRTKQDN